MATGAEQRESMWSMLAIESKHLVINLDGVWEGKWERKELKQHT